jgi:hypothetical protein
MKPRIHFPGHWLTIAELSVKEVLSFLKDAPDLVERSERKQRAISLIEEGHKLLVEENKLYHEQLGVPGDFQRLPSMMEQTGDGKTVIELATIVLAIISFLSFLAIYAAWHGNPFDNLDAWGIDLGRSFFIFLAACVATWISVVILHEGLHGLVLWLFTGKFPKFIRTPHTIGPIFDRALPRGQFMTVLLTPLVGVTAIGLFLMWLIPPSIALFVLIGLFLNITASIGDLWAVWQLLKAGPGALGTAWGIYAPPATQESQEKQQ